jgi:hypothetical protein
MVRLDRKAILARPALMGLLVPMVRLDRKAILAQLV